MNVLVTDFDGTMTQHDFYRLVVEELLPPGTPNYWAEYRSGRITHFEALKGYYSAIRAAEREVLGIVDRMEIDPNLAPTVESLRNAGWEVVITSAGCRWYIDRLLAEAGVRIEVHSNPGRFVEGQGLLMELPRTSPFFSTSLGIDKAGVVNHYVKKGSTVAFAGDGYPDAEPARLVSDGCRFARGDLAKVLAKDGVPFHPFRVWSDIARTLLKL